MRERNRDKIYIQDYFSNFYIDQLDLNDKWKFNQEDPDSFLHLREVTTFEFCIEEDMLVSDRVENTKKRK